MRFPRATHQVVITICGIKHWPRRAVDQNEMVLDGGMGAVQRRSNGGNAPTGLGLNGMRRQESATKLLDTGDLDRVYPAFGLGQVQRRGAHYGEVPLEACRGEEAEAGQLIRDGPEG